MSLANMPPAVTLALFAYNQENYVREAIEGAFAQTFSPMEIILSDDCSTDRTFAIMEEMAASYRGPHSVIARREVSNVGPVQHVLNVARLGQGEFMVMTAGDDICYPDRAGALYEAWKETGAAALSSWHDEIDETGQMLRQGVSFPPSKVTQLLFGAEAQAHRVDGMIETVPGFCSAYPRSFWADLPDPPARLLVEDGLAAGLIIFRGDRIHRVPRGLIAYRLLNTSLSDRGAGLSVDEIRLRERKIDHHAQDAMGLIDFILAQAKREEIRVHPRTLQELAKGRAQNEFIVGYWTLGPLARIRKLANVRSFVEAKYLLPRLFGMRAFATMRILLEKRRNNQLNR